MPYLMIKILTNLISLTNDIISFEQLGPDSEVSGRRC